MVDFSYWPSDCLSRVIKRFIHLSVQYISKTMKVILSMIIIHVIKLLAAAHASTAVKLLLDSAVQTLLHSLHHDPMTHSPYLLIVTLYQ